MRGRLVPLGFTVIAAAVLLIAATAYAGPPPADAPPGSVGFKGMALAGVEPAAAPGYRLVMAESVFDPGAYVTRHFHPTAIIVCVKSGALGFAIQDGSATITRGAEMGTTPVAETLALNTNTVLQPRDCVTFDEYTDHTSHTGWNESDEPTVLWEARLLKIDAPFTTYLNAEGTPVS